MPPIRTIDNPVNSIPANGKRLGNTGLLNSLRVHVSYVQHLSFGQFRAKVELSPHLSSLLAHILRIVSRGSGEKMDWTKTRLNVATMENGKSVRDLPVGYSPRYAMDSKVSAIYGDISVAVWGKTFILWPQEAWV